MHWCTEPDIDIDIHDAMANVINLLFISNGRMVAGFFNFSQNDNADEINVRLCVLAIKRVNRWSNARVTAKRDPRSNPNTIIPIPIPLQSNQAVRDLVAHAYMH